MKFQYDLNVREMLTGDLIRTRYVDRYSTCRIGHRETVAEHSFFVCLYCSLIGHWFEAWHNTRINWRVLMLQASIHDTEESRTGDWPRRFKHSDARLTAVLNDVAGSAMKQLCQKLTTTQAFYTDLLRAWRNAKDASIEGRIVALADFLSVLSYISQEIASGNNNAVEHIADIGVYWEEVKSSEIYSKHFIPLIRQIDTLVEEVSCPK